MYASVINTIPNPLDGLSQRYIITPFYAMDVRESSFYGVKKLRPAH
jgi:hypothetical protein